MDVVEVQELVDLSQVPLADTWLDKLHETFTGKERRAYYHFLYLLMVRLKPAFALELGVEYGLGSAYMAGAAATYGGRVVGVDLREHSTSAKVIPEKYGNYDYVLGDSTSPTIVSKVAALARKHGPLGLVFQDSSHFYGASVKEWYLYGPLLSDEAVWVCDDITVDMKNPEDSGRAMKDYWAEISKDRKSATFHQVLHHGNSMGVILP